MSIDGLAASDLSSTGATPGSLHRFLLEHEPAKSATGFPSAGVQGQNSLRLQSREESWGTLIYDPQKDEFSAAVRAACPPVPESPIGVGWIIGSKCNLRCIHCYGNDEDLPKGSLATEEAKKVVDHIIEARVMRVAISGGEPLLRPDLFTLIDALLTENISVVIGTNGTYLHRYNAFQLQSLERIEISVDSNQPEINDSIRVARKASASAFADAVRAITLCLGAGLRLRVLTTLNAYNQNDLEGMCAFLHTLGVRDWAISSTLPAGRALAAYDALRVTSTGLDDKIASLRSQYPAMTIRYSSRTASFNRYYCLILPDGNVATEDMDKSKKVSFGSVVDAPFSEWWSSDNFDLVAHFDKWVGQRIAHIPARETMQ